MMAAEERLRALVSAWQTEGKPCGNPDDADTAMMVARELGTNPLPERIWQLAAVGSACLPTVEDYQRLEWNIRISGAVAAVAALIESAEHDESESIRGVELIGNAVIVDVHDTARTTRITGIQRVARETARRWNRDHDITLVAWTVDGRALRRLTEWERASVLGLDGEVRGETPEAATAVVPLGGTLLVVELAAETWRAERVEALTRYSGLRSGFIAFDMVPVTAAETAAIGIAAQYPVYLEALTNASKLVAISEAAAIEFRGWQRMLSSIGTTGPEIGAVALPSEIDPPDDVAREEFRKQFSFSETQPLVLVVGSHEPRKNHLAVLHAAELLWREGMTFSLLFLGGAAWGNEQFEIVVRRLQKAKRSVVVESAVSDGVLAAAYEAADFTVFPSTHEGFGLPVAESLALGTPVIASEYGSMKEIVDAGGGGLLVDPRSDECIRDAMRSLLVDRTLRDRLAMQARGRAPRTWDHYAAETWEALVV